MRLELESSVKTGVEPSPCVLRVAAMFGLGVDEQHEAVIVPRVSIDVEAGQVVFVTGPSGGGKSVLLRLIEQTLEGREGCRVVRFDRLAALPQRPLVDSLVGLMGGDERLEGRVVRVELGGFERRVCDATETWRAFRRSAVPASPSTGDGGGTTREG